MIFEEMTDGVRNEIPNIKQNIEKALKVVASREMPDPSPQFASPMALKEWPQILEKLSAR